MNKTYSPGKPKKTASKNRAPKQPALTPIEEKKHGRWRVNVPANLSESGERQRLYFKTKTAATLEAERIRGMASRWGSEGRKVKASLAEDAAKAMDILKGHDITLTALAQAYIEDHMTRTASITMAEVWERYEQHLDVATTKRGRPYSEKTKQTKRATAKKLADNLKKKAVCDVTKDDLEAVLKKHFSTPHHRNTCRRHAAPMFNWAIKNGWAVKNPFANVDEHAVAEKEITVATPEQTLAALRACADHRENERLTKNYRVDCSDALTALAVLAFSGVRPERELPNLQWNQIDLHAGKIRIKGATAKTRSGRYITIEPNLRQWLELVPVEDRQGNLVPSNWKRKSQVIRKLAGFGRDADVFRHTYASYYHRGVNSSVDALRSNLGHGAGDVLFNHYLDTNVEQETALRYWQITPDTLSAGLKAIA